MSWANTRVLASVGKTPEERDEGVSLNFLIICSIMSELQKNESDIDLLVANAYYQMTFKDGSRDKSKCNFSSKGKTKAGSKLLRWNLASWACDYSFLYTFAVQGLHGRR